MEQNFQTSFIPKKPIIKERVISSRPVDPLLVIALFILFTVLLATGGLYFYKSLTDNTIETMKGDLGRAQKRFEPSKIAELQILDKRLRAGNEVLSGHVAVTPIFLALEKMTMKTIRFTSFDYTLPDSFGAPVLVHMSGEAAGYRDIALQSDLFADNKNFIDPVFSNLTLDQKAHVLFDLDFSVDSSLLNYKSIVARSREL